MNKKFYVMLMIFAAIVAGATAALMKTVYEQVPPILLLVIRFSIGFVVIFLIKGRTILREFKREDILPLLILSFIMTMGYVVYNFGMVYTTATNMSFFYSFSVMIIPLLAKKINGTEFKKRMFFGLVISIVGMYLLLVNGGSFHMNAGDVLGLASALIFALQIVFTGRYVEKIHPLVLADFQFLLVALMSFVVSLMYNENMSMKEYTPTTWMSLLFIGIVATAIVYFAQTCAQTKLRESTIGCIYAFIPVFTAITAWILLGETLTASGMVGGALIIGGILLSAKLNKKRVQNNTDVVLDKA